MIRSRRSRRGNAIAEFGPAIFVFLLVIFFPMMDMLVLGMRYGMAWYFNYLECRELAAQPITNTVAMNTQFQTVHDQLVTSWKKTGYFAFLGDDNFGKTWTPPAVTKDPTLSVTTQGASLGVNFITDVTKISIPAFLRIPFFDSVPGLGAPVTFSISSTRQCEFTN